MDNCYSNVNLSFVHYLCTFKLFCSILKEWERKNGKRMEKRKKKNKGQGWPVSPGARIGPGSGSIFPAHIKTGLFSPALKSPLSVRAGPKRAGPPVLTALGQRI